MNCLVALWHRYLEWVEWLGDGGKWLLQQLSAAFQKNWTILVKELAVLLRRAEIRPRAVYETFRKKYLDITAPAATRKFVGGGIAVGMAFMLVFGYLIGGHVSQSVQLSEWRTQIYDDYRRQNELNRAEVALLARKVGMMEARVLRMNVLGTRLAEMHKLEDGEFDFFENPALGGQLSEESDVQTPQLGQSLDLLSNRLDGTELRIAILTDLIDRNEFKQQMLPQGWPVSKGWVSSRYGYRISPFSGRREFHRGIDVAGRLGSEVTAVASGVVKRTGYYSDYGYMIEIEHGNGYLTRYGHNQMNLVQEGDIVKQGDTIALLGNTGRSTGPHLHFEVIKQGRKIDPEKYLMHRN